MLSWSRRMRNLANYQAKKSLLDDRVVLVTGASSGLGEMCAHHLSRHGATICLQGKSESNLEKTLDRLTSSSNHDHYGILLDFNSATELDFLKMLQAIEKRFGKLDGIVHCANFLEPLSRLEYKTLDSWNQSIKVNTVAPAVINKTFLPLLRESGDASIIHISETHARLNSPFWGQYAASKIAMETVALTQAAELEKDPSVRINILIPGPIRTPSRQLAYPGEASSEQINPGVVMSYLLYLIGPDSQDVSGKTFRAHPKKDP